MGVTKAVSDRCGKGGIADRMIWFNGFPFLDNKEDHIFNVPVSHAMTNNPIVLPATDFPVNRAEALLKRHKFQGFPIVEDKNSMTLIGFIGRTELQYAINRAKREGLIAPNAKCRFTSSPSIINTPNTPSDENFDTPTHSAVASPVDEQPQPSRLLRTFDDIASSSGIRSIDFSHYVDLAPITVHPRLPLETVMEIFKKIGPRVILAEHRGRLSGLVTVKDCLKYQFKVEAQELADANAAATEVGPGTGGSGGQPAEGIVEKKAWELIQWVIGRFPFLKGKGDRRRSDGRGHGLGLYREVSRDESREDDSLDIIDGTEDLDGFIELEERDGYRRQQE